MKIQPRQQLLQIWRAIARASFRDGKWEWGGRDGSNSISDAEQLLCIMYPATELPDFLLGAPDRTADDVLDALSVLGDSLDIPQLLIKVLTEYMERYTDDAGAPVFSGESYFAPSELGAPPSPSQRKLDVVDSFSMSITLTLATLSFIRGFRGVVRHDNTRQEVARLEMLASTRLTAAMVGLLRSFSVNVFDAHSAAGRILCDRSNQSGLPERQIIADLRNELREVESGLRDLTTGSGQDVDLDRPNWLFECGWSWGIIKDAARVDLLTIETREKIAEPDGVAEDRPFLYFTGVALDGIEDLFSRRTRLLNLLSNEQNQLARSLQIRWEITQNYWSTIATFDADRWPLEDLPWRTSDGGESDYYSLQVSSIVVQYLVSSRQSDAELGRVERVLEDLANRGRITQRPSLDDPAFVLHAPGVRQRLSGSEKVGDQQIGWFVSNFAPLLLKRTSAIAGLVGDPDLRGALLKLADTLWEHLLLRQLKDGPGEDLWDQPGDAFDQLTTRHKLPSWYHTERVVECLVTAARVVDRAPLHSTQLTGIATDLLYEAEHLFDRELLKGSGEAGPAMRAVMQKVRANLRRAQEILNDRPGSAAGLVQEVLRDLERLAVARQDGAGGT
ncbi:MAG: SCO2524 family protein [Pseudonocardiaceae bacterium]